MATDRLKYQAEVRVAVVVNQVPLQEEQVYLFRGGKLLECGSVDCILEHLEDGNTYLGAARDHFNGGWRDYATDGPHVIEIQTGPEGPPNQGDMSQDA